MTEVLIGVVAALVGAALGYFYAQSRASTRVEAVAEKRANEREARVRAEAAERELIMRADAQRRIDDLKEAQGSLKDEMKALSADVLANNSKQFMDMAEQRLKRSQSEHDSEVAKREAAVREMVTPLAKSLDEVKRQTAEVDKARAEGQAQLSEQVKQMLTTNEKIGKTATDFIKALRRSDVRGNWGEVQLRRVVELSGMVSHVDFMEQENVKDGEGKNLRPDMVVKLAGGKNIVVDSKVALAALIEAFETDDELIRAERITAHARHVKKHIDDLAAKKYWDQFSPAPEFVVMFVPSEAFYQAAIEEDSGLQEYAFIKNVVIATPTTLVAMLRTVAHAWKEDALAENAQEVLNAGQELHKRLSTMGEHFAKLGRALDTAGKAYDGVVGSYERSVMPGAKKLAELKVVDSVITAPQRLEINTRHVRTAKEDDAQSD